MEKYWGYHLILDCSGCDSKQINQKTNIENFLVELINEIKMVAHGKPIIELLLPGESNEGYSVLQMITTSNISAHFVNKTKEAYIDVFSCKEFNPDVVCKVVNKFFSPKNMKVNFVIRNAS
jgi:S-adenosylmethionine/arginine decarboxylase-like enzyme